MLNSVCLMGRLGADPELKATQNGVSVTRFRIAVDRTFQSRGQEKQTDWIDIVAWRNTAEFVTRYFRRGSMIAVQGSLQTRQYTDRDGSKRTAVEVVADSVFFGAPAAGTPAVSTPAAGASAATTPAVSISAAGTPAASAAAAGAAGSAGAKTPDDFEELVGDDELPF